MRKVVVRCRVICVLSLFMCLAASGAYGARVAEQPEQAIPFSQVFVLSPYIIYEDARNEQNLQKADPASQLIFDDVSAKWSADALSMVGLEQIGPNSLTAGQTDSIKEPYDILQKGAEDLIKQWKDKGSYLDAFRAIRDNSGSDCLLVQFIKVKVGDPGGWDFVCTGRVTPTTSSTTVKLALIDLNTGKIWWSNAAIEHYMPDKNNIERLYKTIYDGFPGYKAKKARR